MVMLVIEKKKKFGYAAVLVYFIISTKIDVE